jgi:hypothetical protein
MNREEYQRHYAGKHAIDHGRPVFVPDDIQRLAEHEPCFYCGTARGLCRHRRAA